MVELAELVSTDVSQSVRMYRMARDRDRQRRRRARMTAEKRAAVLEANRLHKRKMRAAETPEQAVRRKMVARLKTAERRAIWRRRETGETEQGGESPSCGHWAGESPECIAMAEGGAAVWKQVTTMSYNAMQKQSGVKPEVGGVPSSSPPTARSRNSGVNTSSSAVSSEVIVLSDEESSANGSPASPNNAPQADVTQIRELLEQEESKLRRLKQLRVIQSPLPDNTATSDPAQPESNPAPSSSKGSKANIVVVPGNQNQQKGGSGVGMGISSRLQHIVDSIAVDRSLPSRTGHGTTSTSNQQKKTATGSSKGVSSGQAKSFGWDVITIADSPSKSPPPLLPTPLTSSGGRSSVQETSISSTTSEPAPPSLRPDRERALMAAVESSKRYRDYLAKHLLAKKSFQKQIERKIAIAPYPKTFRQVWPVIPVYDASFIRNYGLEAILQHFDSSLSSGADRAGSSTKVKPVCNQCGCDFASAWQIRKSNSKQLLLCEACDFANLKILQRSKLANQLRDLLATVNKERDQFKTECEEARKQVVAVEKQLLVAMSQQVQHPPPLFSQKRGSSTGSLILPNASTLTNHVFNAAHTHSHSQSHTHSHSQSHTHSHAEKTLNSTVVVSSSQAVIPSILPAISSSRDNKQSRKRKDTSGASPGPGKSVKLDSTLDKLSKALLEKKLDEQRKERKAGQKKEGEVGGGSSDSRRSKRKGTPRHKRHLSSSSP